LRYVEQIKSPNSQTVSTSPPDPRADAAAPHNITLQLDEFAWSALIEEADAMGIAVEELGTFALLYYLADRDSGRIARRTPAQAIVDGKRISAGPNLRVR
jgi:hypothetical protein